MFKLLIKPATSLSLPVLRRRSFATSTSSSQNSTLYNTLFKTNARYVFFIFSGAALGEFVYGYMGDMVWKANNKNKLYEDVDWSKFKSLYMEEAEGDDAGEEEVAADEE